MATTASSVAGMQGSAVALLPGYCQAPLPRADVYVSVGSNTAGGVVVRWAAGKPCYPVAGWSGRTATPVSGRAFPEAAKVGDRGSPLPTPPPAAYVQPHDLPSHGGSREHRGPAVPTGVSGPLRIPGVAPPGRHAQSCPTARTAARSSALSAPSRPECDATTGRTHPRTP